MKRSSPPYREHLHTCGAPDRRMNIPRLESGSLGPGLSCRTALQYERLGKAPNLASFHLCYFNKENVKLGDF